MKIKKIFPFLLALIIFIISNFIQRGYSSDKKKAEDRIAQIEKDFTAFLQYNMLGATNYNFSQVHLNAVIESTVGGYTEARNIFMSEVTDQMFRALNSLDEAAKSISYSSPDSSTAIISDMKQASEEGLFESFYQNFMLAVQRTQSLQKKIDGKIESLGNEKIALKRKVSQISSNESNLLNFTIAINFLILLFDHIEKTAKKVQTNKA